MSQGKRNGRGLGGLPLHVENAGLPEFWGHFVGDVVYGDVNMTGADFVKETWGKLSQCSTFSMSHPGVLFVYSPQQNLDACRCTLSSWLMSFWRWESQAALWAVPWWCRKWP